MLLGNLEKMGKKEDLAQVGQLAKLGQHHEISLRSPFFVGTGGGKRCAFFAP